jgi:hypothetical protein
MPDKTGHLAADNDEIMGESGVGHPESDAPHVASNEHQAHSGWAVEAQFEHVVNEEQSKHYIGHY